MTNREEIPFSKKMIEDSVNVIIGVEFVGGPSLGGPKPLTIFFKDDSI